MGYMRSTGISYTSSLTGRRKEKEERGEDWLRQDSSRVSAANEGANEFVVCEGEEAGPRWLNRSDGDEVEVIGEEGSTAQVWV